MATDHPFLTVKEAADLARVSENTIYRWVRRGVLRVARPVPKGMILIPKSELRRTLEAK